MPKSKEIKRDGETPGIEKPKTLLEQIEADFEAATKKQQRCGRKIDR